MKCFILAFLLSFPLPAFAQQCACNHLESFGSELVLESNPYGSAIVLRPSQRKDFEWRFNYDGKLTPPKHLKRYYIPWPEDLGGYEDLRAIDPDKATAKDNARMLNSLLKDLIDMGVLQQP